MNTITPCTSLFLSTKVKSKSHSTMTIRRRRVRKEPCTRKTRIRRKKRILHLKLINYIKYKEALVWQRLTLSAVLMIFSTLHSYYTMFCPTKDAPQLFPLINLDCKRKLPHLRWHVFPTDLTTSTTTLTLCSHKIKRFKRWLNSTKFRSHRRRSKIHLNNDTLHSRWTNE